MKLTIPITKNHLTAGTIHVTYETVDTCPICKAKIAPVYIGSSLDTKNSVSIMDFCQNCKNSFITKYDVSVSNQNTSYFQAHEVIYSEPNRYSKQIFDEKVVSISPQFDKIFNQALAAETAGLDEIAGLGYRKAMEFLVKDFAIHESPDSESKIKAMPLAQCIKKHINDTRIVTLAERSAWIGNDEAHYIRKQEDRDVNDMKSFIQAIVYFVGMVLITEDAASMTPKK